MVVRQALRFAAVGVLGFFVDAGVLTFAIRLLGLNLYVGRALSFLVAVTFTWALNRAVTFGSSKSTSRWSEWGRFGAANSVGGLMNLGVYSFLVATSVFVHRYPVVAVAAGSLSGLALNFYLSRTFVFRKAQSAEGC
jgi:putative flippase GtrA